MFGNYYLNMNQLSIYHVLKTFICELFEREKKLKTHIAFDLIVTLTHFSVLRFSVRFKKLR